jgi:hypothetical protein
MKDFNRLGIAIDDLIDAYVQTALATTAIDLMCQRLTQKGILLLFHVGIGVSDMNCSHVYE